MADEIEKLISLAKSLKMIKLKPLPGFERSLLPLAGVGVAVSYFKAIALHSNILFAAESLMNAIKVEQKNWKDEISEFPMFERTMHLQNAIITYNNCVDYMYQVLYFFLDIDGRAESAANHSDIDEIAKKVGKDSYRSYNRAYIQNEVQQIYPQIYKTLMLFEETSGDLREKANSIKHQASFWVDRNHININGVLSKKRNGQDINLTEIVVPPNLNIYGEIASLIVIHNKLVDLEKTMFEDFSYETKVSKYLNNLK